MASPTAYAQTLIRIANKEYETLHEVLETDEPLRSRIDAYCEGIGIGRPSDIDGLPWSASLVCCGVKAAVATEEEFKSSSAHAAFVTAAIANADHEQGVFRARQIDERTPQVGDIIQRNHKGGTITYKQARM